MSPDYHRPTVAGTVAMVEHVSETAERVAAGLRALLEPEAAALVSRLGVEASQAAAALRELLEPAPRTADWYLIHRELWIRYGDPGDLAAMTQHIADAD